MKKRVASVVSSATMAAAGLKWSKMDYVGYRQLSDLSDPQDDAFAEDGITDAARTVAISIQGMTCGSCVRKISESVGAKQGVESISVSLESGSATVKYDPSVIAPDIIASKYLSPKLFVGGG